MSAGAVVQRRLRVAVAGMLLLAGGCSNEGPVAGTVVCIGDSLTAFGGAEGRFSDWLGKSVPGVQFINKGIPGDTLFGGRKRFQRDVLAIGPDVVVIALGTNDFYQGARAVPFLLADLEDMVGRAKEAGIEVVVASIFGGGDDEADAESGLIKRRLEFAAAIARMEEDVCRQYDCFYVPNIQGDIKPAGSEPYWDDAIHPSRAGNEFVAQRILPAVKKALARAAKR